MKTLQQLAMEAYEKREDERRQEAEAEHRAWLAEEARLRAEETERTRGHWDQFVEKQPEPREVWTPVRIDGSDIHLQDGIVLQCVVPKRDYSVWYRMTMPDGEDYQIVEDLASLGAALVEYRRIDELKRKYWDDTSTDDDDVERRATFPNWLQSQLDARGWNQRDLVRKSGLSPSAINHVIRRNRNAGSEFCTAVARAFDVPAELVFRSAGLLPHNTLASSEVMDNTTRQIIGLLREMSPSERVEIAEYVSFKFVQNRRRYR